MRKVLLGITIISCLLLTGCDSEKARIEELDNFGQDYYEKHYSGVKGVNMFEIKLEGIRKAAIKNNYKLNKLEKCDDETKVIYTIKKGKIVDKEFVLKCN